MLAICMEQICIQQILSDVPTFPNTMHTSPMAFSGEQQRSLNGLNLLGNLGSTLTKDIGIQDIMTVITG